MYHGGLKLVPPRFKRLVIQQSVHKVKLNLQSGFSLANLTLVKHDYKFNFTLLSDCRITNLLNPRGTNFSPPQYVLISFFCQLGSRITLFQRSKIVFYTGLYQCIKLYFYLYVVEIICMIQFHQLYDVYHFLNETFLLVNTT